MSDNFIHVNANVTNVLLTTTFPVFLCNFECTGGHELRLLQYGQARYGRFATQNALI